MKDICVGFALGSGSFRGISHIGFLQVMDENGIPVNLIAGSSIGSFVGALYCAGMKPAYMKRFVEQIELRKYLDVVVPRMGFYKGEKAQVMVRMLTANRNIEDLSIPFAAVATDINTCQRVVLRTGKVHDAVRASISIPGVFVPHIVGGRTLVDGGVIDRVPASIARDMGADVVIAVDVGYCGSPRSEPVGNVIDIVTRSLEILEWEAMSTRVKQADVWVSPRVMHINPTSLDQLDDCYERGIEAGNAALPAIRDAISAAREGRDMQNCLINLADMGAKP